MEDKTHLSFQNLTQRYGTQLVLDQISLEIKKGETLFLIGESGCGKTTLLKTLCQLLDYHQGHILVNGQELKDIPHKDYKKRIGYVIQAAGLAPHMNLKQNVQLPAKIHRLKIDLESRTKNIFESLNLNYEQLKDKFPYQISGGQKQRVSIARALINDPEFLFMDEPFGALDPLTKNKIYKDFLSLKKFLNKTIVIVSHDMNEAKILADRIAIINKGQFEQVGTYEELVKNPKSEYVKNFLNEWVLDEN